MSSNLSAGLGIDFGTTGVRISIVTSDLQHVEAQVPLPPGHRTGNRHEQDSGAWWRSLEACLGSLVRQVDPGRIGAFAVDGTSGTILFADKEGTAVTPALMYDDGRAGVEAGEIAPLVPAGGLRHSAVSPLAKALWLARHSEGIGLGGCHLCHQADWVAGKITGKFGTSDENNALKTGYDPVVRIWPAWVGKTGIPLGSLPAVLPSGSPLGNVDAGFAEKFGFSRDCKVVLGTTDSIAAFLATPAELLGDASTSWGTTLAIKMIVPHPVFDHDSGVYSHRLGDRWLVGGASNVGGAVLLEHFTPEEIDSLSAKINPETPTGLSYYPLVKMGERFPICDPTLRPRLEPRPQERHLFLQAIFEGMAEVERLAYEQLEKFTGVAPRIVYSTGGVSRNRVFLAIRRRVLGKNVFLCDQSDAAYGVAKLAMNSLSR